MLSIDIDAEEVTHMLRLTPQNHQYSEGTICGEQLRLTVT